MFQVNKWKWPESTDGESQVISEPTAEMQASEDQTSRAVNEEPADKTASLESQYTDETHPKVPVDVKDSGDPFFTRSC